MNKHVEIMEHPHFKPLKGVLEEASPTEYEIIYHKIINRLDELLKENDNLEAGLKTEATTFILPAIASYTIMREYFGQEEAIRLFRKSYYVNAYSMNQMFKNEASSEEFRKSFPHFMMPSVEGEAKGFIYHAVQDDEHGCEFHILRCPYVSFCKKYGCSELVTSFCDCDDAMFKDIHPKLVWARNKTIGHGDELCNFKFIIKN